MLWGVVYTIVLSLQRRRHCAFVVPLLFILRFMKLVCCKRQTQPEGNQSDCHLRQGLLLLNLAARRETFAQAHITVTEILRHSLSFAHYIVCARSNPVQRQLPLFFVVEAHHAAAVPV